MSFFPLPYYATVSILKQKAAQEVTDRSGQVVMSAPGEAETVVLHEAIKCLYSLTTSSHHHDDGVETYKATVEFYTEPTAGLEEGMHITNIRTKAGEIIEAGPFKIDAVRKVPGLSGKVHHLSCKIKGVNG